MNMTGYFSAESLGAVLYIRYNLDNNHFYESVLRFACFCEGVYVEDEE